jgi:DnaK suppressor protein
MPVKEHRLSTAERKSLRARLQQELGQASEALARIDSEGYGYCIDCGVGIAIGRLMAEPFAMHCMRCEARAESRRQART